MTVRQMMGMALFPLDSNRLRPSGENLAPIHNTTLIGSDFGLPEDPRCSPKVPESPTAKVEPNLWATAEELGKG